MDMHLNVMVREPERFHSAKTEVYSFALACFVVSTSESTPFPFKEVRDPSVKASKDHVQKGKRLEPPPNCPFYLSDLIYKICFGNRVKGPNFDFICTDLRHIKEFLLTGHFVSLAQHTVFVNMKLSTGGTMRSVRRFIGQLLMAIYQL
jgi:hypothetical protein